MKRGHLNVFVRDHESTVTGFGTHDRVVWFWPKKGLMTMRVDHLWGLGMPTERQMLAVAREGGLTGRYKLVESVDYGYCTEVCFTKK
jgi:hypothetical protein